MASTDTRTALAILLPEEMIEARMKLSCQMPPTKKESLVKGLLRDDGGIGGLPLNSYEIGRQPNLYVAYL